MTTIRISKNTKKLLDNLGSKNESYEDIILELIKSKEVKK